MTFLAGEVNSIEMLYLSVEGKKRFKKKLSWAKNCSRRLWSLALILANQGNVGSMKYFSTWALLRNIFEIWYEYHESYCGWSESNQRHPKQLWLRSSSLISIVLKSGRIKRLVYISRPKQCQVQTKFILLPCLLDDHADLYTSFFSLLALSALTWLFLSKMPFDLIWIYAMSVRVTFGRYMDILKWVCFLCACIVYLADTIPTGSNCSTFEGIAVQ